MLLILSVESVNQKAGGRPTGALSGAVQSMTFSLKSHHPIYELRSTVMIKRTKEFVPFLYVPFTRD
jgi:hypothetical protein